MASIFGYYLVTFTAAASAADMPILLEDEYRIRTLAISERAEKDIGDPEFFYGDYDKGETPTDALGYSDLSSAIIKAVAYLIYKKKRINPASLLIDVEILSVKPLKGYSAASPGMLAKDFKHTVVQFYLAGEAV